MPTSKKIAAALLYELISKYIPSTCHTLDQSYSCSRCEAFEAVATLQREGTPQ